MVVTVVIVGALIAARAAAPTMLREIIASEASKALHTRVDVGGVELSLLAGRFGLRDVVVYPPKGSGSEDEPVLGARALEAEIDYEALRHHTIRITEIVLDTPRVAVDRLSDGQLNLQSLAPAPTPTETPAAAGTPAVTPTPAATATPAASTTPGTPTAEATPAAGGLPPGWSLALDRFVLRGGGVRFRDLFTPQSQPIEIEIPAIEIADVSFQAGRLDRPAKLLLDVRSEGGRVKLEAALRVEEKGLGADATLEASALPLRRARLYISGVGWSSFHGLADASLRYTLATGAKNELAGTITVRDLEVKTPKLPYPALAWERLSVKLAPVDVIARNAAIESIELQGASIAATLRGGEVLPVVAPEKAAPAPRKAVTPSPAPTATPTPGKRPRGKAPPPAAEAPAGPKPWTWSLGALRISSSRFMVDRPGRPLPIGVSLDLTKLSNASLVKGAPAVPVSLGLKIGAGTIDTVGRLRIAPPAFGGSVRYSRLDVREVIPTSPSIPQRLVQSAVLGGELAIEAGIGARGEAVRLPDAVRLRGRLSIEDLKVAAADPQLFNAGWKRFDLRVDDAVLPGALATSPAPTPQPMRVSVGSVRLDGFFANVTRDASGIVLPDFATNSAKPAPTATATPVAAAPQATPPPAEVSVAAAEIRGAGIKVVDRTVNPPFSGEITPIDVEARAIRLPGPSVGNFKLTATGFQGGKVEVNGALRGDRSGNVDVSGTRIGLSPFNPYVTSKSSYGIGGGAVPIHTKANFTRSKYDTENEITVHKLELQGAQGDALFQQQFGVSLSTALALLTDLEGDIHLDVPVTVDESGTQIDFGAVIASALKDAVIGAALSPLKMLGAMTGGSEGAAAAAGGEGKPLSPPEPPAAPALVGRAELSPEGSEQLGKMATLLANRPALAVDVVGLVSSADLRFVAEQNLRVAMTKGDVDYEGITGLFSREPRRRVLQALSDRAMGKPGELSEDDQKVLDALLEDSPPPSAEDRRALAVKRADNAIAWLSGERGIDAKRLHAATPDSVEANAATGGVRGKLALPALAAAPVAAAPPAESPSPTATAPASPVPTDTAPAR